MTEEQIKATERERKKDRVIARYCLDWNESAHPHAEPGALIEPTRVNDFTTKEALPNFTTNDHHALDGLKSLLARKKDLAFSMKGSYIEPIQSMYYSVVIKRIATDNLLLYNGTGRTLAEAITEALIKYKNVDWQQMLDKA